MTDPHAEASAPLPASPTSPAASHAPFPPGWQRFSTVSLAVGGVVWVAVYLGTWGVMPAEWAPFDPFEALLLLAPLVVVPLGLRLLGEADAGFCRDNPFWWIALAAQPFAAVMLIAGLSMDAGIVAAVVALPWAGVTGLIALSGLWRIWRRRRLGPAPELAIDTGLALTGVAGAWLIASQLGFTFDGHFEPIIVFLTAVHFHYIGFATGLIFGHVGRLLDAKWAKTAFAVVVGAWIAGTAAVATGITAVRFLEFFGAACLAVAFVVFVIVIFEQVLPRGDLHRLGRVCLVVAALSILSSMGFALIYAFGRWQGEETISIPTMRVVHGAVNALGFALAGLVGVTILRPHPANSAAPHAAANAADTAGVGTDAVTK